MKTRDGWKAAIGAATVFLVFCLSQMVVGLIVVLLTQGTVSANIMAVTCICSSLLSIAAIMFIQFRIGHDMCDEFNPRTCRWQWMPIMIVATLCGMFCFNVLTEQMQLEDMTEQMMQRMSSRFWGIVSIVTIGPIAEEVVFRSAIIRTMIYYGIRPWGAIIVSALLFAIVHFNPAQMPFAFIIGILFAILYVKSRSILPSTVCHILNNGISVILMNVFRDQPAVTLTEVCGGPGITYPLVALTAIVCFSLYYYYWKRR